MTISSCERCTDLIVRYHEAIADFVEIGKRLAVVTGSREKGMYDVILAEYQRTGTACKNLRALLLAHLEARVNH
jgi:hypothetical protein